jgi:hypothetical protein
MERSDVKCFHCTPVFDLTNLKGEKRRNVGKLNNELIIVNQLFDLHFLLFVNITGRTRHIVKFNMAAIWFLLLYFDRYRLPENVNR